MFKLCRCDNAILISVTDITMTKLMWLLLVQENLLDHSNHRHNHYSLEELIYLVDSKVTRLQRLSPTTHFVQNWPSIVNYMCTLYNVWRQRRIHKGHKGHVAPKPNMLSHWAIRDAGHILRNRHCQPGFGRQSFVCSSSSSCSSVTFMQWGLFSFWKILSQLKWALEKQIPDTGYLTPKIQPDPDLTWSDFSCNCNTVGLYYESIKTAPFYFCNNSVKSSSILIIFGICILPWIWNKMIAKLSIHLE